jgi:hypothetical protein
MKGLSAWGWVSLVVFVAVLAGTSFILTQSSDSEKNVSAPDADPGSGEAAAHFEVGSADPTAPQSGDVTGDAVQAGPDWADLFDAVRSWKDVVGLDDLGQVVQGANGVPDFLELWGDYRSRRDAAFIADDVSRGVDIDSTVFVAPGIVDVGVINEMHDLGNLYAYTGADSQGRRLLYAGVERLSTAGPTSVMFEFTVNQFGPDAAGVIQGERADGDLRVIAMFGASELTSVEVQSWDAAAGSWMSRSMLSGEGCNTESSVCVTCNGGAVAGGGWLAPSADGSGNLPVNTFLELGVNVDALLGTSNIVYTGTQISTPEDYAAETFALMAVEDGCVESSSMTGAPSPATL